MVSPLLSKEGPGVVHFLSAAERLALLDQAFRVAHLQKLPIAWGNSWQTLKERCHSVGKIAAATLKATHAEKGESILSFDITALGLSGTEASLLSFEFVCRGQNSVPMQIAWEDATMTEQANIQLTAQSGRLVVPMDSYPRWLLAEKIDTLQFRFPTRCQPFALDNIEFFQRNSVVE